MGLGDLPLPTLLTSSSGSFFAAWTTTGDLAARKGVLVSNLGYERLSAERSSRARVLATFVEGSRRVTTEGRRCMIAAASALSIDQRSPEYGCVSICGALHLRVGK